MMALAPTAQADPTANEGPAEAAAPHVPVMLAEVIAALAPKPGETILDGTFGAGGYTKAILATGANVVALDRDPTAIAAGQAAVEAANGRLGLIETAFSRLDEAAASVDRPNVDGVVLDIGVSSMQLDRAERGFSFRNDGPLDMRMAIDGPSAADVVNELDEKSLAKVLWVYGDEKRSREIARAIVASRARSPITRTGVLADLIDKTIGRPGRDPIHPATRSFQALRIFVNRELDELADALAAAERALAEGGRLVIVAFHSLEDRIVKRFLADRTRERAGGSRHAAAVRVPDPTFHLTVKGALEASDQEIASNPRARSAKLRAAVRTAAPARGIDRQALGVPAMDDIYDRLGMRG
jgi:16S rRNA (cytosine1402-N4)-methyltransferase